MVFNFIENIVGNMFNSVPEEQKLILSLSFYTFLIVIYSIFIWKFYGFLARRDILDLNLKQYNRAEHPGLEKFIAICLFGFEYIVIMPFLVLFWFVILGLILLFLSNLGIDKILLISAVLVSATRVTSYIKEELSKELAKVIPYTLLITFLVNPLFISTLNIFERITTTQLSWGTFFIFIGFICGVELIFRGAYSINSLLRSERDD